MDEMCPVRTVCWVDLCRADCLPRNEDTHSSRNSSLWVHKWNRRIKTCLSELKAPSGLNTPYSVTVPIPYSQTPLPNPKLQAFGPLLTTSPTNQVSDLSIPPAPRSPF
jgi:hypothetical protein